MDNLDLYDEFGNYIGDLDEDEDDVPIVRPALRQPTCDEEDDEAKDDDGDQRMMRIDGALAKDHLNSEGGH